VNTIHEVISNFHALVDKS